MQPSDTPGLGSTPVTPEFADRLARGVALLSPDSVLVTGDGSEHTLLNAALQARGITVGSATDAPGEQAPPRVAVLALVRAGADLAAALSHLSDGVGRVLIWAAGDVPVGPWARTAATLGYFRSARRAPEIRGASCLLVEGDKPTAAELADRYEAILDVAPDAADQIRALRHQLLTSRDHAVGTEAEIARLREKQADLEADIAEILATTTWRVGTRVISPLGRIKRALRR